MLDRNFTIKDVNFKKKKELDKISFETIILFQLSGKTKIYYDEKYHILEKGQILIINRNKPYSLRQGSEIDNVLISLSISNSYFSSIYEDFVNASFELSPGEDFRGKANSINELKIELSYFIIYYLSASSTKNISLSITLNKIILILVSYFKKEENIHNPYIKDEKIKEILKYIDKYYYKNINIENLSQKYYISASTLSKNFKDQTGKLFSKHLNEVRITKSLKDLLYSSLNIEEVANKNGFENTRTYRRRFKEVYKVTPSEYREKLNMNNDKGAYNSFKLMLDDKSDVYTTLHSYTNLPKESLDKAHTIENNKKLIVDTSIDRKQVLPTKIIHVGSLEKMLEKDIVEELDMVKSEIGFNYVGVSSILNKFPDTYLTESIEESYIFSEFGKFDYIVEKLIKDSLGIFYQIEIPNDKLSSSYWELLKFLRSTKNVFGKSFLEKFKINCIFNISYIKENYKIFKEIYKEVKNIDSRIELGVSIPCKYPSYSFNSKEDEEIYLNEVLPLTEFLSFTSEPNRIYDYSENIIVDIDFFNEFVYKETVNIKNLVKKWNVDKPLVLSEWNTLTGVSQNINGTFFRAGIILQEILKLDLLLDAYGFWLNAGIYRNYKFDKKNKYSGLELFHNYSGRKPVYHVLSLSARLRGNVRFLGNECMLLQEGDNYQLIIWNPNYFNPKLSEEIRFLDSKSILYNIEIPMIKDNYYQVKKFDLSREDGAIYYVFQNFKSKEPIDIESREYIAKESRPRLSVFDVKVENGFKYSFVMDTNAVTLLEFKPMYFKS